MDDSRLDGELEEGRLMPDGWVTDRLGVKRATIQFRQWLMHMTSYGPTYHSSRVRILYKRLFCRKGFIIHREDLTIMVAHTPAVRSERSNSSGSAPAKAPDVDVLCADRQP